MHAESVHLFVVITLGGLLLAAAWWRHGSRGQRVPLPTRRRLRLLRPRTPADCPMCRAQEANRGPAGPPPVRPWREMKSRRGAPKRIATHGYACWTSPCLYYGITPADPWRAWGQTDQTVLVILSQVVSEKPPKGCAKGEPRVSPMPMVIPCLHVWPSPPWRGR
jgi:hypothetical protein